MRRADGRRPSRRAPARAGRARPHGRIVDLDDPQKRVELSGAQHPQAAAHADLDPLDRQPWPRPAQPADDRRPGLDPARGDVDSQRRAPPAPRAPRGVERLVGCGDRTPRRREHRIAGRGELDRSRLAVEEHRAELALELLDRAAERLLGDVQPSRRRREAALLGHREERPQGA
jgi:hypothetical protein